LSRLSLEIIELPDRRISAAAIQVAAEELGGGDTEVSVLLPRLYYTRVWHRLLHDRTADAIAQAVGDLPHCNVTIVPYHLRAGGSKRAANHTVTVPATNGDGKRPGNGSAPAPVELGVDVPAGTTPLDAVPTRSRVKVVGRVHAVRVQPWGGAPSLEATI